VERDSVAGPDAVERLHPREVTAPHVVILGAGASRACCPHGDADGRLVPLTDEIPGAAGITDLLSECGISWPCGQSFESVCHKLYRSKKYAEQLEEVERRIRDYFARLRLPNTPTTYDHLLLALTPNDLVATFNWDPLLAQAYRRCHIAGAMPKLAFLHGNVAVNVCYAHRILGYQGEKCRACGQPMEPTRLLYPVPDKNYTDDPAIHDQWSKLDRYLECAYFVTIFGYSAPRSDAAARGRMKQVWAANSRRNLLQVNFIVRPGTGNRLREIEKKWAEFLVGNHHGVCDRFEDSWLYHNPRGTCWALWQETMECDLSCPKNPFPACRSVEELRTWVQPLIDEENDVNFRVERWRRRFGAQPSESKERVHALAGAMRHDFLEHASRPGSVAYSHLIVRSIDHDTYPEPDPDDRKGISNWFKVDLLSFYDDGIEVWLGGQTVVFDADGSWSPVTTCAPSSASQRTEDVIAVGRIPFANIVSYDLRPDDWYGEPKLFCRFCRDGMPHDGIVYARTVKETPEGLILDGVLDGSKMQRSAPE